ncbi:MAG: enoyl-CoA hydratase [Burkholderiaceae bacterium]|nr:enoyl-CoA hydratase [Burkholderiaceae bacterium]
MSGILQHHEHGVLTLTFNRLERKNSITVAMYAALADALERSGGDAATRAVVIQGHETVFCAGNDIGDFLAPRPAGRESPAFRFLRAIAAYPKPLLAAVCGPAVGIGTTMLFHCDLVYAGDNAAFSMPFVNLGLCPEAASSLLAPRLFGWQRAAEALLLGEPFMAEAALEAGLVNRIVAPSECNALAQAQARKLAAKPLSSLTATKQLMKGEQQQAVLRRIDEEGEHFARLLGETAAREAMTAFLEKRKPDFSQC